MNLLIVLYFESYPAIFHSKNLKEPNNFGGDPTEKKKANSLVSKIITLTFFFLIGGDQLSLFAVKI